MISLVPGIAIKQQLEISASFSTATYIYESFNYFFTITVSFKLANPLDSVPKFILSLFIDVGGSGSLIENETIHTPITIATKLTNAMIASK
jgi:hypothetical protein